MMTANGIDKNDTNINVKSILTDEDAERKEKKILFLIRFTFIQFLLHSLSALLSQLISFLSMMFK